MLNKITILFLIICITLLPAAWAASPPSPESPASPKETSVKGPVSAPSIQPKEKEGVDLIIILDCSGSMKKTDPQDLRKAATELIVSLLGAKDRIGLVSFGGLAQTLIPLTDNLPANQKLFSQAIQKQITSEALYTNIYEAVKKGYEEMKGSARGNKILLLMSDGQMDLGSKEKDNMALQELFALVPELTKLNIKLYTVAFTDLSDQKLLADLAEKTKGLFQMAKADKDIHVIFSSIFEQVKLPDTVPLEGNSFLVDKDIQEVTVLITKQVGATTTLLDPQRREWIYGKLPETIGWLRTNAFDLITIKSPVPGRWKVQLSSKEGNKIFVVTDLALKTSLLQNQIVQGQEMTIEAWLERQDNKIVEKRFLDSIFFMADITDPKGNHTRFNLYPSQADEKGDRKGMYIHSFTFKDLGVYTVLIVVDGKTFKRELVRQVKILNPPASTHSASTPVKTGQAKPEDLWARAIKTFLMINGGLFLLAILMVLVLKWKAKRAVR
jgi:Mg-chelatase subunit ChlD